MKKILRTVAMTFLAAILALPTCASAADTTEYPQYISAVGLAAVQRSDTTASGETLAIDAIKSNGFEYYLDYDFNKFSQGDYVILGYNRTDDESKAIRSLGTMFVKRGDTAPASFNIDGIEYLLASNTEFNSGTEFTQVYLYYSVDTDSGDPLKELYVEDEYVEPDPDTYPRILVNSSDGEKGELDYLETSAGDTRYLGRCYLYRDFDKERYELQKDRIDDPTTYTADYGSISIASIFREEPALVIAVAISAVIVIGGIVALVIRRRAKDDKN